MLCSCLQRLNSEEYCSTHQCLPVVLDKWSRVFAACELSLSEGDPIIIISSSLQVWVL